MFKKIKQHLLIFILVVIGVIFLAGVSFAAFQTKEIHHERLDTGVIFIWSDGKGNWQNNLYPGGPGERNFSLNIGKNMKDVNVKAYTGSNFSFGDSSTSHWNETVKCYNQSSYNQNYVPYSVTGESHTFSYDESSGKLTINQNVTLSSSKKFDVADYVRRSDQQTVYDYLGNPPANVTEAMNKMLTDPSVQGYLYFCPLVITYTEVTNEEVPDPLVLEANLMLPPEGETDTPYTAKDITMIPQGGTFQSSKLEISSNGGETYTTVTSWPSHTKNAEMGDSQSIAGTYKYRLTVYLTDGTSDTDEKSIVIKYKTPKIQVFGEAKLVIPEYTYEGHKFPIRDESTFTVTDEEGFTRTYSAQEAYKMGIASSEYSFSTGRSDYDYEMFNDVKGEGVFFSAGTKHITLTITLKDGTIETTTVSM